MEDNNFTFQDFISWVKCNIPNSDWILQLDEKDVEKLKNILRLN